MLNIYLDRFKITGKEIVTDIEKEFAMLKLRGTELEKLLVQKIEKGRFHDKISFIDRFGYKLYNENLSTGCKAALCVVNKPDKVIDLIECGNNARDIIIALCREGNILMHDNGITISSKYRNRIEVGIEDKKFTDVNSLNQYLEEI